jgi:hypothetical protein
VVLYVVVMAILIGTEYVMSNRPSSEEPVNTVIEDTRPDNQPATPSSNADP